MTFPKNAWYVAATSEEVADKPLGRMVCGERMVFYRSDAAQVAALQDFCPHRGAPLSLGRVCEGKLVCGYHGLEMGCDGKTVAMPGQRVDSFPPIRAYPAVERMVLCGCGWVTPPWPMPTTFPCRPGMAMLIGPTAAACSTSVATTA